MKREFLPPSPQAKPIVERIHGIEIEDRFRWLEDQNSSSTREFIRTEQRFFETYLELHQALRSNVESRVRQLLRTESRELPVPDRRGGLIYGKRHANEEQASLYHRDSSGAERLILSSDAHSSLSVLRVSADGRFLAYALRTEGADRQEVAFYDLLRHHAFKDRLARGLFRGLVFDQTGKGAFYVQEEGEIAGLSQRSVRYHVFGNDQNRDEEVFACGSDPSIRLRLIESEDSSGLGYTIFSLSHGSSSRFLIHRFPLSEPPEEIAVPVGIELSPRFGRFGMIASTTWRAPLGRIVFIPHSSGPEEWIELIPESGCRLHAFDLLERNVVVHYSDGPRMRTSVYSREGAFVREITYPEGGTVTLGRVDSRRNELFFTNSDVVAGSVIYAIDLNSGKTSEWWKTVALPWNVAPTVERHYFPTLDGTRIPLTIVRPAAAKMARPTVLTVYGSRGSFDPPKFSAVLTVLVEAGFNYATAHIGMVEEFSNRRERQQSSVDAVVAAAQWLIENEYTTPDHLALAGQSHGALITLCTMIERPDLFRAIVALGPIADLARFHLFGVGRWFMQELGSPEDPEDFSALLALSPYHRIRRRMEYPATLIISGDLDKRCDAMHARKMIAALRESNSLRPIVLDYSEHRGHKPGLPIKSRIRSLTDRLTFLVAELTDGLNGADVCNVHS
ncbi:MAG TPA: prolyl oligopeptidase family serine peptidase [Alloacidobacterium sp.]|nr:prolyl oligopeptidase family serine peptidase [Alloacidobacterium sp.]